MKPVCLQNNTAYRVFHYVLTDFTKAFYFLNVMFSRCTYECNSIHPLPLASIFANLIKYQQYYVQISLCRMSSRSTVNVQSTDRNSFTSRKFKYGIYCVDFHETQCRTIFADIYTECYQQCKARNHLSTGATSHSSRPES
jgi:hypothetical protein